MNLFTVLLAALQTAKPPDAQMLLERCGDAADARAMDACRELEMIIEVARQDLRDQRVSLAIPS
jgi:hypothetical protein